MVLPLIGLGMMVAGTAANMYGSYKRDKATRKAMRSYQDAADQRYSGELAAANHQSGALSRLASERQSGVGDYIRDLQLAQRPSSDEGFAQRQTGALTGIREMTKGLDGTYEYSGAPMAQAEGMQAAKTTADNKALAEALLADDELGRIKAKEAQAQTRMAFGDIIRRSRGTDMQQRFSLAKALRDLDWQRKTAAMQSQLDDAQKTGQWMNVLGGLGTQLGGTMMTAGLGQGGPGGGSPGGMTTAPAGATDLRSFQGSFTDPQMSGQWS